MLNNLIEELKVLAENILKEEQINDSASRLSQARGIYEKLLILSHELEQEEKSKTLIEEEFIAPQLEEIPEITESVDDDSSESEKVISAENIEEEPPPAVTPPAPPPPIAKVEEVAAPIVDFPDVEAGFPGGPAAMMKWINDNVKYPQTSIEMNEQGRVFLSFVVETNGSISNVKIERGISIDLDREAKRVIKKMPKWVPGESAGRAVRARCRLPINFQLQ